MTMAFMYILRCADGSFYVGSTAKDVDDRVAEHNDGFGAQYTIPRRPVCLFYHEEFDRVEEAYFREKQVQGWGRAKRIALITGNLDALRPLSRKRRRAPAIE